MKFTSSYQVSIIYSILLNIRIVRFYMNVIIVNDYASVQGGAAQVAVNSARGLAEKGMLVCFIFASGNVADELYHPNITLVNLEQFDLLGDPSRVRAAVLGLWNPVVKNRIEILLSEFSESETVVHIHSWVKALSISAVYAVKQSGFKTVVTLHDYFTACPNGGFFNFKTSSPCHLTPLSYSCLTSNCDNRSYTQKLWRVMRQYVNNISRVFDKNINFIYVSDFSLNILKWYLPKDSRFWFVPNPTAFIKPQTFTALGEAFTYIGRLAPEKGVLQFARAAAKAGVKTRFVGTGELEDKLKQIIPNAEFTGWADKVDVQRFINDSRAVVMPSQLFETQGLVVAEASSQGVPCIVSDICAGREYVDDGVTGLWYRGDDESDLVSKIELLSTDFTLAQKLGSNAFSTYWKAPTTLDVHVERLIECYSLMLAVND